MNRRLALLAVVLVAAACTPASSPSGGLETTPPLSTPGPTLESSMPSSTPSMEASSSPELSPGSSASPLTSP